MSSLSETPSLSHTPTESISTTSNKKPESQIFDASASEQELECPVCGEIMVNLFQLDRHFNDLHDGVSAEQKDGFSQWLKNSKNTIGKQTALAKTKFTNISNNLSQTVIKALNDPEVVGSLDEKPDYMTKAHWQQDAENDCCSNSGCDKQLGLKNGRQNCRKYA